jgi:hypothetical protein
MRQDNKLMKKMRRRKLRMESDVIEEKPKGRLRTFSRTLRTTVTRTQRGRKHHHCIGQWPIPNGHKFAKEETRRGLRTVTAQATYEESSIIEKNGNGIEEHGAPLLCCALSAMTAS